MEPTVLIVEDDSAVRQGVVDALTFAGYNVLSAADGEQGMEMALRANYQLLLLDLVLPTFTGFDILKALSEQRPGQAVIILSARGEEDDRVKGLSLGADDYVMKPFSVRELLARVDAVLRRVSERPASQDSCDLPGCEVSFSRLEISFKNGERTELSDKEAQLLRYLVMQKGRVVSRDELYRQVWRVDASRIETRAVDMHVARLRAKLQDKSGEILRTVRGKGYMIEIPS